MGRREDSRSGDSGRDDVCVRACGDQVEELLDKLCLRVKSFGVRAPEMKPYWLAGIFLMLALAGCSERSADVDATVFIQKSVEGLRTQTTAHAATWHLGEEANWDADQDAGRLRFTFDDGTIAEAEFQIVGTYNTLDGTFLWGWDHPSVAEPLRKHASLAKQFGAKHGLSRYTDRKVKCSEEDAWEFTAVAARLANANGAYRGPAGTALVYMTFGEMTLHKP